MAQYECPTLLVTQADVSFLSLHGCKVKIISIFTSDYLAVKRHSTLYPPYPSFVGRKSWSPLRHWTYRLFRCCYSTVRIGSMVVCSLSSDFKLKV
jgi:hypothetical protein